MSQPTGSGANHPAATPVPGQAIHTDETGIVTADVQVPIGGYRMPAYEARPASGRNHPIVAVICEIFGLHEHIRDCARRFARAGYHAIAPELFQREGGVGHLSTIDEIRKIVLAIPREQVLGDIAAAIDWARTRSDVARDRVGVTGWCWGGSTVLHVAATNRDVKAAVAWYGPPAREYQAASGPVTGFDIVGDIRIPFLGLFGETDANPPPDDARRFGELLGRHNPNSEVIVYPGAGHGFYADYRPSYHPAAAADAWRRCLAFFDRHLKA